MALGAIELGAIARSQDYTAIKQNEDNRGITQQSGLVQDMKREVEHKNKQVNKGDDAAWQQKKFDAKEKGSGSYEGDGGSGRRKDQEPGGRAPDGRIPLQGGSSFDIKI